MNEVEKMYENVNLTNFYCGDDYVSERMLEFECTNGNKEKCKTCDKAKTNHPPFTAEKQLSLMAFLINRKVGLSFKAEQGEITVKAISRGLAGIVNNLWQDLTEEERKQIKEILE